MTADFAAWHDEHLLDHRRRLRTAMCVSLAIHGLMFAVFAAAPPAPVVDVPKYVAVDLVAALPSRPAPARSPAPAPAQPKPPPAATPAPAPAPAPAAPPPPPVAKAPVQVLPEETPGKIRKAKPEPELSKATPEPKPQERPARRRRGEPAEQVSLEDLLAEEGPDEATAMLRREDDAPAEDEGSTGTAGPGIKVSPEQLAWDREVISRVSDRFVDLARYRNRGLVVRFRIRVGPGGELIGKPDLLSTSGDVDFDRSALSAVLIAGPFPPPLTPEPRILSLRPEAVAR
ncbi:MAG: cell envelope integrity protein TolA [bacterium]|nr:cell envelope integrity protein TolA [bacterium]